MMQRISSCECGQVQFETTNEPILVGVCYCDDCQAGSKMIEALPNAPHVLDEDDGSSYLTYRDDHFKCISGEELLLSYEVKEKSKTKRYVASCCNSAMYLKFSPGHWVSTYRNRYKGNLPQIEMRTQIQFRQSELPFPDEAPTYKSFPLSLFAKLIKSRIAMAFGR